MELIAIEPQEQEQGISSGHLPAAEQPPDRTAAGTVLEFGRFQVLLRKRQLLANGAPTELGTRAFDVLMVLLEADGSLVTKNELMTRVWPGIVVTPDNLKVQICALRNALGKDRDFIRTEFGRGYRFTAALRRVIAKDPARPSVSEGIEAPIRREAALRMELAALSIQLADLERKRAELVRLLNGRSQPGADRLRRQDYCARLLDANRPKRAERRRRRVS